MTAFKYSDAEPSPNLNNMFNPSMVILLLYKGICLIMTHFIDWQSGYSFAIGTSA